jgi:SHS2 domain-containing protein
MTRARHLFAEHTGELEIRLEAESVAELFAEAGRALAEVMGGDEGAGTGPLGAPRRITLTARDREALLVALLDELIFLTERESQLFPDVRVERIGARDLVAVVRGRQEATPRTHVKAATFHGLRIVDGPAGVTATVILDV